MTYAVYNAPWTIKLKELGIVNTIRFINQFTVGYGNYTEERKILFGDMDLDAIITEIRQQRNNDGD